MSVDITIPLDVVVRGLRSDQPESLQKAVYYLTTIRNEHNVAVLINEIVASPAVLQHAVTSVDATLKVIEGIRAAGSRKMEITDPTIWPERWADIVVYTCGAMEHGSDQWRAVPVLAGLLLSNFKGRALLQGKSRAKAEELLIRIANQVIASNPQKSALVCFSLARAHSALDLQYFAKLDHEKVLLSTMELLYQSPEGLCCGFVNRIASNPQQPLFQYLSEVSHMIKATIEHISTRRNDLLDAALNYIVSFNHRLRDEFVDTPQVWSILKLGLFALSIQLQGFCTLLLRRSRFSVALNGPYFAAKILQSLQPVYYIVLHLSSAGFAAFDFVYYVCIDILLQNPHLSGDKIDTTARILSGAVNTGAYREVVARGQIVYMLNFFEQVVAKHVSQSITTDIILPIARDFLVPKSESKEFTQPLLEAAHSVILAYLTAIANPEIASKQPVVDNLILEYLDTTLSLFPEILSHQQLTLAVMALANVVTSPVYRSRNPTMAPKLADRLYFKARSTPMDVAVTDGGEVQTTRTVIVGLLIHTLPFCETSAELTQQLNAVAYLIKSSSAEERPKLQGELWNAVSGEIGLQLADVAIQWWYTTPKL